MSNNEIKNHKAAALRAPGDMCLSLEVIDTVDRFLTEACQVDPGTKTHAGDLHRAFRAWCAKKSMPTVSANQFAAQMAREFETETSGRHRVFLGLRLKMDAV